MALISRLGIWAVLATVVVPTGLKGQPYVVEDGQSGDAQAVKLVVLRDEAGGVEAAVAPDRGGELCSLKVRRRGQWIETLYLASDYSPREDWTGKAPILWPATGATTSPEPAGQQNTGQPFNRASYLFDGKRYPMPGHGFARGLPWKLERKQADASAARVTLSLEDTGETRKMYPFGFLNSVEYVVTGGKLQIRYKIRASKANSKPMFFSLGNHITFVTPLLGGTDPGEVVLISPSREEILKDASNVPSGETRPRSYAGGVKLGDLEPRKPVSLTGYDGDPWVTLKDSQGLSIRMSHHATRTPPQPVVQFNLWGDAAAGFFSPEPWVGLQNSFVLRKGLVYLDPGEEFAWIISIEFEQEQ